MPQQNRFKLPRFPHEDFESLPGSVKDYLLEMTSLVVQLIERVHELEAQLAKNSSNSSKPPSGDGPKKPNKTKSLRGTSDKKPGGQPGHPGRTLEQVENPDYIITYTPEACNGCGHSLNEIEGASIERRQVFDLPEPKVEVTEHRIEVKMCPCCGSFSKGTFPENITAQTQYGSRVQALAVYFAHQHYIPFDRLSQMFQDIYGISISPATCATVDRKLFAHLESFEVNLKAHLIASKVLNFDETGMRCNKKLHWIHVASSQEATFYDIHTKRGQEAMDDIDILPKFHGTAIHDHWYPYFAYEQVTHGLCNAHHLRELTFVYEQEKEIWAQEMMQLLLKAKQLVADHSEQGCLSKDQIRVLEEEYAKIVLKGLTYHLELPPLLRNKRGKRKQRVGKNLLNRLADSYKCVLRFIYDFSVPFTNNRGEQDIRMVKLKQKISGCFRKIEGAKIFCRIRSYISTSRKQGWRIWDALTEAINGRPRMKFA